MLIKCKHVSVFHFHIKKLWMKRNKKIGVSWCSSSNKDTDGGWRNDTWRKESGMRGHQRWWDPRAHVSTYIWVNLGIRSYCRSPAQPGSDLITIIITSLPLFLLLLYPLLLPFPLRPLSSLFPSNSRIAFKLAHPSFSNQMLQNKHSSSCSSLSRSFHFHFSFNNYPSHSNFVFIIIIIL